MENSEKAEEMKTENNQEVKLAEPEATNKTERFKLKSPLFIFILGFIGWVLFSYASYLSNTQNEDKPIQKKEKIKNILFWCFYFIWILYYCALVAGIITVLIHCIFE